jgi:hypothetical protein
VALAARAIAAAISEIADNSLGPVRVQRPDSQSVSDCPVSFFTKKQPVLSGGFYFVIFLALKFLE